MNAEQKALEVQWFNAVTTNAVDLAQLNLNLRDNTFVCGTAEPVELDTKLFNVVLPKVKELVNSTKDVKDIYNKFRHVIRWVSFMQQTLKVEDSIPVNYDLALDREVIEKKKKKDAAAAAPNAAEAKKVDKKADKKADKPKGKPDEETLKKLREEAKAKKAAKKAAATQQQQQPKQEEVYEAGVVDFRVGFIQKAIKHPNADSLYVSTIDVGDEEGPRTVCSGLVKHFSLEAMQERYVVVVCNLKPVNMRSIKSTAMVLCGSTDEKVEFVEPPAGSKAGDKVFFEGFGDFEPLKQLNPKKKIWEQLQPSFTTNENKEVIFKKGDEPVLKLTNKNGDVFKVATLVDAQVR